MTTVHTGVQAAACADSRRTFLKNTAAALATVAYPAINFAQTTAPAERRFAPLPGNWRTFEVTTRVDIAKPQGSTRVWLPVPSVNSDWQKSLESSYASNGKARLEDDDTYGARMLYVEFAEGEAHPYVELTSRIQTQNRAQDRAGGHTRSQHRRGEGTQTLRLDCGQHLPRPQGARLW
jgi:hypothetical protein